MMNRHEILQKLSAGEITTDEAIRLLEERQAAPEATSAVEPELGATPETTSVEREGQSEHSRWLHVRVTDLENQRDHVRVNIPLGVVAAGLWVGSRFSHRFGYSRWADLIDAIREGAPGTLVEVEDIEKGERVHIYVD